MIESDRHIIFVKHSLPEVIPDIPPNQWRLGKEGRVRCLSLAEALAPYRPDVIVSSLEPKAVETAELIANVLSLAHQTVEDLHEHQRDNEMFDRSDVNFQEKISHFFEHPEHLVYGLETANQAYFRFSAAVNRVIEANHNQTVVFVTHGTVISLLMAHVNQFEPFPFWKSLGLPSFVVTTAAFRLLKVITGVKSG